MRLTRAVDVWIGELARAGRQPTTLRLYRNLLEEFLARFDSEAVVSDPTTDDCRRFLDRWLAAAPRGAQANTALRGFFAFLVDEGERPDNPMDRVRRPKLAAAEDLDVVTVSSDEVQRMFAACTELDEFLTVALLAYLGPRRSAAAGLRWRDIDFSQGDGPSLISFREKGGKTITKPMPDELSEILYQIALFGQLPNAPGDHVIPSRQQGRAGGVVYVSKPERDGGVIYERVRAVAERAGVNAHPHALRAAFACHYLEGHPGDLDALQKLLGHKRVQTTQIYLRRQDKRRAMERVRDLSWGVPLTRDSHSKPNLVNACLHGNAVVEPNAANEVAGKLGELVAAEDLKALRAEAAARKQSRRRAPGRR